MLYVNVKFFDSIIGYRIVEEKDSAFTIFVEVKKEFVHWMKSINETLKMLLSKIPCNFTLMPTMQPDS